MKETFKAYLNQKKAENLYSSSPSKELLGEGIFANSKKEYYKVVLDFTSEYVVDTLSNMILSDYRVNKGSKTPKGSVKDLISNGSDEFPKKLQEKVADIFMETIKAAKNLRKFLGLSIGKEASALACIQTVGSEVSYVFFKGPKKDPEAYAQRFRGEIARNPKIAILAKGMNIVPEEMYTEDVKKNRKEHPYYNDPAKAKQAVIDSGLVNSVVDKILPNVQKELREVDERNSKGNLITVYSVPFKVDETLIKDLAKENKDVTTFYEALANKINDELAAVLKQVPDLKDYFGFVPTKTYGFNLYFRDRDTAEGVAEILNQDNDLKVSERKRFEKKMVALNQLLGESPKKLGSLRYPSTDAVEYFRGTLFAKSKVASLIKDILPAAEDQQTVYQYVVRYDEGEIKKLLSQFGIEEDDDIKAKLKEKLQGIIQNLQKTYDDELISLNSEGKNLIFFFKKTANIDAVKTKIASAMSCELTRIKVAKTAMTGKEMKSFRDNIMNLDDLQSFYNAIEYGENIEVIRADMKLKDDAFREMVTSEYEKQANDFINKVITAASVTKGFLGLTAPMKDLGKKDNNVISLYFKDEESFKPAKEAILQIDDSYISEFPDDVEKVKLKTEDAKKLKSLIDPTSFINYLRTLFDKKSAEEKEAKKQKAAEKKAAQEEEDAKLSYQLNIPFSLEKFYDVKIGDVLKLQGLMNVPVLKESSFGDSLKRSLLKSIHLFNEAKTESPMADIIKGIENWAGDDTEKLNSTLNDYVSEGSRDSMTGKKTAINNLLAGIIVRIGSKIKSSFLESYNKEQIEKEFKFRVENYKLTFYASKRVAEKIGQYIKSQPEFKLTAISQIIPKYELEFKGEGERIA